VFGHGGVTLRGLSCRLKEHTAWSFAYVSSWQYNARMELKLPALAMELRHNDEAVGRVFAGAIDVRDDEEVYHAQARFWHGLRGIRSRLRALPPMHIVFAKV